MTPSFKLRPYLPSDAEHIADVFFRSVREGALRSYSLDQVVAWAPEPPAPATVHARASDGRTTLVAVTPAGAVIGYGDLEPNGHLDHLYCRPEIISRGVGSALIEALLRVARSADLERVYVDASEIARTTFERNGFIVSARRD